MLGRFFFPFEKVLLFFWGGSSHYFWVIIIFIAIVNDIPAPLPHVLLMCRKVVADILLLIAHDLASPGKDRSHKQINIAC